MPQQFENGRKLDGKNSLQDFDAKEVYLHHKNRSVSFQKRVKNVLFSSFSSVYTMPFPKCAGYSFVFKIYRFQNRLVKMCRFRVNGRPIRQIFHRFQYVPALCERSLTSLRLLRATEKYGVPKNGA